MHGSQKTEIKINVKKIKWNDNKKLNRKKGGKDKKN
jgi:hypothetical protein